MIRRSWVLLRLTRGSAGSCRVQQRILLSGRWHAADSQRKSRPLPDTSGMSHTPMCGNLWPSKGQRLPSLVSQQWHQQTVHPGLWQRTSHVPVDHRPPQCVPSPTVPRRCLLFPKVDAPCVDVCIGVQQEVGGPPVRAPAALLAIHTTIPTKTNTGQHGSKLVKRDQHR